MTMLVFVLPVESGEKIAMGVAVFLAYTFQMIIVSETTPKTGNEPRLG